jgi:nucleotide-binding universal stress UspA family protein
VEEERDNDVTEGSAAVSGVRRVFVGVSGSPGSLRALRQGAELARAHDATLVPVITWVPPGGEVAERRCPSPYLRAVWRAAAARQLREAIELGLGGAPVDLHLEPQVVRGEPGQVLVGSACEPGDLIVVGAGRRGALNRLVSGHVTRFCVARASCPVVTVPPSQLEEAAQGMRGWSLRHRAAAPEDALHQAGRA